METVSQQSTATLAQGKKLSGVSPYNQKHQNLSSTSKPGSRVGPHNSGVIDTAANSTNRSG